MSLDQAVDDDNLASERLGGLCKVPQMYLAAVRCKVAFWTVPPLLALQRVLLLHVLVEREVPLDDVSVVVDLVKTRRAPRYRERSNVDADNDGFWRSGYLLLGGLFSRHVVVVVARSRRLPDHGKGLLPLSTSLAASHGVW